MNASYASFTLHFFVHAAEIIDKNFGIQVEFLVLPVRKEKKKGGGSSFLVPRKTNCIYNLTVNIMLLLEGKSCH